MLRGTTLFYPPRLKPAKPEADLFTLYAGNVSSLEENFPRSPKRLQGEFIRPYTGLHHPPALCAEQKFSLNKDKDYYSSSLPFLFSNDNKELNIRVSRQFIVRFQKVPTIQTLFALIKEKSDAASAKAPLNIIPCCASDEWPFQAVVALAMS